MPTLNFCFSSNLNKNLKFQNLLRSDIWELLYLKSSKELLPKTLLKSNQFVLAILFCFSSDNIFETLTFLVYNDWSDEVQMKLFDLLEVKTNNFL